MGPNETKLRQVESAIPGALTGKAIDWEKAKAKLQALHAELVTAQQNARETWTQGSDAEAADAAFSKKLKTIERTQARLERTAAGMRAGAEALSAARSDLQGLPAVSPAPGAGPTRPGADASDADIEAYNTAKTEHDAAASSHATSMDRREEAAAAALKRLDAGLAAAQKMLANAAPAVDKTNVDGAAGGGHRTSGGSGPGLSGTPVVGGTTAVSAMASAATLSRGPLRAAPALPGQTASDPSTAAGGDGSGDDLTDLDSGLTDGGPSLGEAGGMGAGGMGGVAGAAGLLGAGKGILAKAAGAAKGASATAASSGRTAGMAKGSTLGSSSQAASRAAAPAESSSARPSAQAGRPAPGTGSRASSAGTRAGQGQGAGRPGAGQGRPAGGNPTGRGGNAARSGAGNGGQGRRKGEDDDPTLDHLAFDDDQWLDDEETSPGVLT